MTFPLNIADILLLSLAIQCIVLSGIIFYRSKKIGSNFWIGAVIFVFAHTAIIMEIFSSSLMWQYPMLSTYLPVLKMLLGPLIYFYTRSLVYGTKKISFKEKLHFIPVLIDMRPQLVSLLYYSGLLHVPFITDIYVKPVVQHILFGYNLAFNIPTLFSMLIYTAISFKMVSNALKNSGIDAYKQKDLKWLKMFLIFVFIVTGIFGVSFIGIIFSVWNQYILYLPAIAFIYYLGMRLLVQQSKMTKDDIVIFNRPPARFYFTPADAEVYRQKLVDIMENDKLYLNPALNRSLVAQKLGIPEKMISNLVNQYMGKNFNDFVNEYRVQEVMKQLNSSKVNKYTNKYTIATIAFDCGFNSLASFQRCFKDITGLTPTAYQNQLKQHPVIGL